MSTRSTAGRILVVDDAPDTVEVIERNLRAEGYQVLSAGDVATAIGLLEQAPVDLVITDVRMPAVSGMDLVRHVRENMPETVVVVITGYASIDGAVEAVKKGAEEYLAKPFTDEELLAAVQRAWSNLELRRARHVPITEPTGVVDKLLGESPQVIALRREIEMAARSSATVLITGESGTGKELVARAIHYAGARAAAAFVPVNCAGIPESLLESTLFGHVKGAFTGASETRAGFFQTSDGGTLFLDELGSTSLAMQAKLLRVLEDRQVLMVGDTRPQSVDVRILAATSKDLPTLIEAGTFREDLYYRLNVLPIRVPPLRERGGDIPLLTRHFAARFAAEQRRATPSFTEDALRVLADHTWPGNVRELENVIQRILIMVEHDPVDVPDLPHLMRFVVGPGRGPTRTLREMEDAHIRAVLASTGGNKKRAAEILAIDRKTLHKRLQDD